MSVWDTLSDVQADAVRATAERHLRDADELAEELAPLLTREDPEPEPFPATVPAPVPALEGRTVVFQANVAADPSWSLLGTTESGSTFLFPSLSLAGSTVNESLTPTPEKEHTP